MIAVKYTGCNDVLRKQASDLEKYIADVEDKYKNKILEKQKSSYRKSYTKNITAKDFEMKAKNAVIRAREAEI